jgi:pimeloyl-ACP methyl ester carboxylesterase
MHSIGSDFKNLGCFPRSWGERDAGSAIFCLHGLGDWGRSFEALAASPHLTRFRILAPDLPGYGESPRPVVPTSLEELAEQVAKVLEESDIAPVVLLGHSMGGTLAQLLAERHPRLVSALVNVEGNVSLNDCAMSGPVAASSLTSFAGSGFKELLGQVQRAGPEDPAMVPYGESLRLADPATIHRHASELVALSRPADLARRLAALPLPTLYIAGSPGGMGPRSLDLLCEAGVNLKILSPSGHCPHLDLPGEFAVTVAEFLESTGAAAP